MALIRRWYCRPHATIVRAVGWKNLCAMRVGTNALKMTTVTSTEYCCWSMILFWRPKGGNRAEGQTRGHEQRRVVRLALAHRKASRERPDPDDLRHNLDHEQSRDHAYRRRQSRQ